MEIHFKHILQRVIIIIIKSLYLDLTLIRYLELPCMYTEKLHTPEQGSHPGFDDVKIYSFITT